MQCGFDVVYFRARLVILSEPAAFLVFVSQSSRFFVHLIQGFIIVLGLNVSFF